jgi:lipopolysaccharide export system permease protein
MIQRRAVINELVTTFLAVLAVLLAISITTLWIRFLGRAAGGTLAPDAVLVVLGFSIVNYLPVLLPVTLFVATLLTLTRMARDSELVVWQSVGVGATAWVRPVLFVALPLALFIGVVSLVIAPWATQKAREFRSQLESREEIAMAAPGVFKESKAADRVFFVENLGLTGDSIHNIFVRSEQHGKLGIVVASKGSHLIAPNKDRFIVLENGRRYEGIAGQADYKVMQFERYMLRLAPFEAALVVPNAKSLPTWVLLGVSTLEAKAELQWRFALPIAALLLALLAIPMSYVNPRSGRSFHLIAAVLIYMIYNNLLSMAQAWVAQGKLTPWVGLWGVHVAMLAVITFLFYRRLSVVPLFGRAAGR